MAYTVDSAGNTLVKFSAVLLTLESDTWRHNPDISPEFQSEAHPATKLLEGNTLSGDFAMTNILPINSRVEEALRNNTFRIVFSKNDDEPFSGSIHRLTNNYDGKFQTRLSIDLSSKLYDEMLNLHHLRIIKRIEMHFYAILPEKPLDYETDPLDWLTFATSPIEGGMARVKWLNVKLMDYRIYKHKYVLNTNSEP